MPVSIISLTTVLDARFIALVSQLDAYQSVLYPAESDYSMPLDQMAAFEHYPFIAEIDGVAVGCACLFICANGLAEVKRVYVNPDYRGQRIAERLMDALNLRPDSLNCQACILKPASITMPPSAFIRNAASP